MTKITETAALRDKLGMSLDDWLYHNHWTHDTLAVEIGVSRVAVTNWVNGVSLPSPENMRKLREITGGQVTSDRLIYDLRERATSAATA
jgi:transcriptional regulator with XRE-family HTH domain